MLFKKAATCLCLLYTVASQATTIFSDNFDADAVQLNATVFQQRWQVRGGTVDVHGDGLFDLMPHNGQYVDLDGSTSNAGRFYNAIELAAGRQYTLSFDLAGNHRNADQDTVQVEFGSAGKSFTVDANDVFRTFSVDFIPDASGLYDFGFHDLGHDNQGALLDRVSITYAVPEPATVAMLLGGLTMLVARVRRNASRSGN